MRAAKAEAVADYLSADLDTTKWTVDDTAKTATAYYDAGKGTMVKTKPTTGYGKGTTADGGASYDGYTNNKAYTGQSIKVVINTTTGEVTETWE